MNLLLSTLAAAPQTGGFDATFLIMIVAIFAIMYFFMIRPQQKKQKEIQKFRNSLEPGMEVVTYGGLHGTIKEIDDAKNIVVLEIARDVKVKVEKTHLFAKAAATQQVR